MIVEGKEKKSRKKSEATLSHTDEVLMCKGGCAGVSVQIGGGFFFLFLLLCAFVSTYERARCVVPALLSSGCSHKRCKPREEGIRQVGDPYAIALAQPQTHAKHTKTESATRKEKSEARKKKGKRREREEIERLRKQPFFLVWFVARVLAPVREWVCVLDGKRKARVCMWLFFLCLASSERRT